MNADILSFILYKVADIGGDEHDQHSFMTTSMGIYEMTREWRSINFSIVDGIGNLPPYIVSITKRVNYKTSINIPEEAQNDIPLLAFSLAFREVNNRFVGIFIDNKEIKNTIIIVNESDIFKYKEAAGLLYDDDPSKSRIIFTSYKIRKHYTFAQNMLKDDAVNRVLVSTYPMVKTYLKKKYNEWIGNKTIITNRPHIISIAKNSYIGNNIRINLGNNPDITIVKRDTHIAPKLNIEHAYCLCKDDIIDVILNIAEIYKNVYVLGSDNCNIEGYNNYVSKYHGDDKLLGLIGDDNIPVGDSFNMVFENNHIKINKTIKGSIVWRTSYNDNIVPMSNIIIIGDNYPDILSKRCPIARTLNITHIHNDIGDIIDENVLECNFSPKDLTRKNNGKLKCIYGTLKMCGIDFLTLGKYEQYILSSCVKKSQINEIINTWIEMNDNKLTFEMISEFLKFARI
jgi:hypothetical protein